MLLTGFFTDSEPAYFWYQHQVKVEAHYLVAEALPDWKHKATRVARECDRHGIILDPVEARAGARADFAKWFSTLRNTVQEWKKAAEAVEVPDFDLAVADFSELQKLEKSSNVERPSLGTELADEGLQTIEKIDSGLGL